MIAKLSRVVIYDGEIYGGFTSPDDKLKTLYLHCQGSYGL